MRAAAIVLALSGCLTAALLGGARSQAARETSQHASAPPLVLARSRTHAGLAFRLCTNGPLRGGVVVDAARGLAYVGSEDGHLNAFGPDGVPRWKAALGAPIHATPRVLSTGEIAVATVEGALWLVSPAGTSRLVTHLEGPVSVALEATPDGVLAAVGSTLLGIGRDGREWLRFAAWDRIAAPPRLGPDGRVYVAAQDDHLHVLAPEGELIARAQAGGDLDGAPLVDASGVYVGSDDGRVHGFDRDARARWSTSLGGYVRAPLVRDRDGLVIATTFGPRPRLVWLDADTGAVRRQRAFAFADGPDEGVAAAPLPLPDGGLLVVSPDDRLMRLRPDGIVAWAEPIGAPVREGAVALAEGLYAVAAEDGCVHTFRDAATVQGDEPRSPLHVPLPPRGAPL